MTPLPGPGRSAAPGRSPSPAGRGPGGGPAPLLRDEALAARFDRAARAYDRMVAVNPGYHRDLRRAARRLLAGVPLAGGGGEGLRLLDVGCGTGASTAALAAAAPGAEIVAVDASAGMLERAAAKRWGGRVTFVHAPAERLAEAGVRGPFDAVLAAYLVRNLARPDPVLRDLGRLAGPDGRLAVHEYTLSGSPAHRLVWNAVCAGVIVPLGSLTAGGPALYRHLRRSVLDFDTAPVFRDRLLRAGFTRVRAAPVPGWQRGIVHTFLARAPGPPRPDRAGRPGPAA